MPHILKGNNLVAYFLLSQFFSPDMLILAVIRAVDTPVDTVILQICLLYTSGIFGFVLYYFYSRMKRPVREMKERCQRIFEGEEGLDFGHYNDEDLNALSDTCLLYTSIQT